MSKISQAQKIINFLKVKPNQEFTAREIASNIVSQYPEDYVEKKKGFANEKLFLQQIVAEIGSQKNAIVKGGDIFTRDKPRPRLFWYSNVQKTSVTQQNILETTAENTILADFSEHDLYPKLIEFLAKELNLYCLRIDEKRSKNNRGQNGNQWLHPDIVAMQPLDKQWNELVKTCVKHSSGQNVRLWSFEVKKTLNNSNVRSSFFQAVSNSSWANEGYLVTTEISNSDVEEELRMLSALHGIGVIVLNNENPTESEILLPARRKTEADWHSIHRILVENKDFESFIQSVSVYYQTGQIFERNWTKAS